VAYALRGLFYTRESSAHCIGMTQGKKYVPLDFLSVFFTPKEVFGLYKEGSTRGI